MPVGTQATIKGVPQDVLESSLGAEILLANTYHLLLRPGAERVRELGGLHRFMSWPRALLTDSGGFQVFSLAGLRKLTEQGVEFRSHLDGALHTLTPESATAAQIALGADIIMAFDECTEYPASPARARESMELTLRWAQRSRSYFEQHKQQVTWSEVSGFKFQVLCNAGDNADGKPEMRNLETPVQQLFGIIQGGMEAELRRESAQRTIEIGFDGYAIGGLSVGEPRQQTREVVEATAPVLPADHPPYLKGVGTPEEICPYAA